MPDGPITVFGADGGATRTRAALADVRGRLLWHGEAGGSSVTRVGIEETAGITLRLLEQALEEASSAPFPSSIACGYAGARPRAIQDSIRAAVLEGLAEVSGSEAPTVEITHDVRIALWGAAGSTGAAAVVLSGTGSVVVVRNEQGEEALAGGRGWPLGDEGSAAWLGWAAVRRVLDALEADRPGMLATRVLEAWKLDNPKDLDPHDLVRAAAAADAPRYGALSPVVLRLAQEGDDEALDLIVEAGLHLGLQLAEACDRIGRHPGDPLGVYLAGGLGRSAAELLAPALRDGASVHADGLHFNQPLLPPLGGALLLAGEAVEGMDSPFNIDALVSAMNALEV